MSRFSSYREINAEAHEGPLDQTTQDILRLYNRRVRNRHCLFVIGCGKAPNRAARFFAKALVIFSAGVVVYVAKLVYL